MLLRSENQLKCTPCEMNISPREPLLQSCAAKSTSVVSNSVWPCALEPTRLLHSWDSPGKSTGVACKSVLVLEGLQRHRTNTRKINRKTYTYKESESEAAQSCPTLQPHGLQPTRLLHPWDFPGRSTGVACHCLLIHIQRETQQILAHVIMEPERPHICKLGTQEGQKCHSKAWEPEPVV